MRKAVIVGVAGLMALLLSSCFMMQGFSVLATSVQQGKATKAQFVLRPASTTANKEKQFVIVGVPTGGDLIVGKAVWGTNGKFGGPYNMSVTANLPGLVASEGACNSNGLNFASVTNIAWKGFLTPNKVGDKGQVSSKVVVQAVVKAAADAGVDSNYTVLGVTGQFVDNDANGPDTGDFFGCTGIASVSLYVAAG